MVNRQVEKAKLVPEKEPFDFLGHITYDFVPEVYSYLFYANIKKTKDEVFDPEGNYLCTTKLELPLRQKLIDEGYKINQLEVKGDCNRSLPSIKIDCNKTSCRYYKERFRGACRIRIKAEVEVYKNKKRGKRLSPEDIERDILLSFPSRSMDETTIKSRCLMKHIFFETGRIGKPDAYSKIQRC